MGLTSDLCNCLTLIELNNRDQEQMINLITDFFAAMFAGYQQNSRFNSAVEDVVLSQGGIEESTVFLQSRKYPARIAAFMNSLYGHGAELDDGNKRAAGHAGVHIIPAVFALAEKLGSSNADVLIALATGYETFIRISSAAQPGLVKRGFHSTGVTGTLACAAAGARLFHLNAEGIEDSIALATTMTGGLLSYGDSKPAIKPLNPGKAAENGVLAAMLAANGVHGPNESLEGPNGWFHAVTDKVYEEYLKGSDHLLLHDCYFKLYPSCRHTHCGIDAAVELHKQVEIDEIEKVNLYIYPNAIKLAGIRYPHDRDETKFSIPYTLAIALLKGTYGISDMEIKEFSPEMISLMDKIQLIPDESMEDRSTGTRGARLEIILKDGSVAKKTVFTPRGDPENPLSSEEIAYKLRNCAEKLFSEEKLTALIDTIQKIKGCSTFENPMRCLQD